jgi:hypothetical protein
MLAPLDTAAGEGSDAERTDWTADLDRCRHCAEAGVPKQVLILHSFRRDFAPHDTFRRPFGSDHRRPVRREQVGPRCGRFVITFFIRSETVTKLPLRTIALALLGVS